MPIIDLTASLSAAAALAPAVLLARTIAAQKAQLQRGYAQKSAALAQMAKFIFACPLPSGAAGGAKFTPQQVLAAWGADAADLLKFLEAEQTGIAAYSGSAPAIVPAGYTLAAQPDGTVSVTGEPAPAAPAKPAAPAPAPAVAPSAAGAVK